MKQKEAKDFNRKNLRNDNDNKKNCSKQKDNTAQNIFVYLIQTNCIS